MTVKKLAEKLNLQIANLGNRDIPLSGVYCCDLLSIVMGKAFANCAWVTVMGNINSVAVASLAEIGVIILAEGAKPDANTLTKAEENGINILISDKNIFETALEIHKAITNG